MEQVIEAIKTALPGLLGATSQAVVLTKGTIKRRAGVLFMSSAAAYYAHEHVAYLLGWPTGMSSFVVGLMLAPTVDKLLSELNQISLSKLIGRLLGIKDQE